MLRLALGCRGAGHSSPTHCTQTTRLASRTGTPPAVSDIWIPPAGELAGIWIFACQTLETCSAETETTVPELAVTTGDAAAPRPLRNSVTTDPAGAGFRQVLTEPPGFNASGNNRIHHAVGEVRQSGNGRGGARDHGDG